MNNDILVNRITCSWCHEICGSEATVCWNCGHNPSLERTDCDCKYCQGNAVVSDDSDRVRVILELPRDSLIQLTKLIVDQSDGHVVNRHDTVIGLLEFVACSLADGYRRPGSWERGLLEQLGLMPG